MAFHKVKLSTEKKQKNNKIDVRKLERRPDLFNVLNVLKQWGQGHIP